MNIDAAQSGWRRLGCLLLLLVVFTYPIRYIQQIALGRVIVYTGSIRLALFLLIFSYAILIARFERSQEQIRIVLIGYVLVAILIYDAIVVNYGLFYTAYGFNLFWVPPGIALIFLSNSRYFPTQTGRAERRTVHLLLSVAIPIAVFGIVQHMLNDPILRTSFADNSGGEYGSAGQAGIKLTELVATRSLRASSIFDSAIDFGHFSILFALLCMGMAIKSRHRPKSALGYITLMGIFSAAVISTSTRNILIYYVCCGIGCLLICAGLGIRTLIAATLASVVLFYGTIYGLVEWAPGFFAGFLDDASLFQRAFGVYVTVDRFIVNADSLIHILFGFGYMQSVDFKFLPTVIFDNTELDIYLYAGVCGVLLYMALLFVLFRWAIEAWRDTGSVAWLAAASMLMGTPLFSTLNIHLDQPYFQFVFALLVGGAKISVPSASSHGNASAGGQLALNPA